MTSDYSYHAMRNFWNPYSTFHSLTCNARTRHYCLQLEHSLSLGKWSAHLPYFDNRSVISPLFPPPCSYRHSRTIHLSLQFTPSASRDHRPEQGHQCPSSSNNSNDRSRSNQNHNAHNKNHVAPTKDIDKSSERRRCLRRTRRRHAGSFQFASQKSFSNGPFPFYNEWNRSSTREPTTRVSAMHARDHSEMAVSGQSRKPNGKS